MGRPMRQKPEMVQTSLYMSPEMLKQVKKRAEGIMISKNSWILQAIAERIIREDKAQ
jgi:hypothetical protein